MAPIHEKATVSAQVDLHVRLELERLATEADRSLSAEVRRAVNEHIRKATSAESATA